MSQKGTVTAFDMAPLQSASTGNSVLGLFDMEITLVTSVWPRDTWLWTRKPECVAIDKGNVTTFMPPQSASIGNRILDLFNMESPLVEAVSPCGGILDLCKPDCPHCGLRCRCFRRKTRVVRNYDPNPNKSIPLIRLSPIRV